MKDSKCLQLAFPVLELGHLTAVGRVANTPEHDHTAQEAAWPRGYKTFSMLNSAEHEIINAHKFKSIKKISIFQAHISLECCFSCS